MVTPLGGSEYDEIRHDLLEWSVFPEQCMAVLGNPPCVTRATLGFGVERRGQQRPGTVEKPFGSVSKRGRSDLGAAGWHGANDALALLAPKDVGGLSHNSVLKHRLTLIIAWRSHNRFWSVMAFSRRGHPS